MGPRVGSESALVRGVGDSAFARGQSDRPRVTDLRALAAPLRSIRPAHRHSKWLFLFLNSTTGFRMHSFLRSATMACAVILGGTAASAQPTPPAPPARTLPKVAVPSAPSKPPVNTRASAGPGTQTEDDIYVGVKRPVQNVNTPQTTGKPPVRSGAGVSPNTGGGTQKSGGDDDLDDLEVERRTVQGVELPSTGRPQLRPGAGTSPNTGRSAGTTPAPAPNGQPPRKP